MEALAHGLVTLCQELSIPTSVHFGCEKHFKSCIDRLFGWCRGCLQRHLDRKKRYPHHRWPIPGLKIWICWEPREKWWNQSALHLWWESCANWIAGSELWQFEDKPHLLPLCWAQPVATRTKIIQPCFLYTPLQNRIRLFLPAGKRAHSMAPRILRRWPENLGEAPTAAWPTGGD